MDIVEPDELFKNLPNLRTSRYRITSPATDRYNCIAYAAGDKQRNWWPEVGLYWPEKMSCEETLESFLECFASLGFEPTPNGHFEPRVEKVAFYATAEGIPTHAALQRSDRGGRWTSKLGANVDIEHDLVDLEGGIYGSVACFMRRSLTRRRGSSIH